MTLGSTQPLTEMSIRNLPTAEGHMHEEILQNGLLIKNEIKKCSFLPLKLFGAKSEVVQQNSCLLSLKYTI
jgi:hypothetical protein